MGAARNVFHVDASPFSGVLPTVMTAVGGS